jgi:hypothetical protein
MGKFPGIATPPTARPLTPGGLSRVRGPEHVGCGGWQTARHKSQPDQREPDDTVTLSKVQNSRRLVGLAEGEREITDAFGHRISALVDGSRGLSSLVGINRLGISQKPENVRGQSGGIRSPSPIQASVEPEMKANTK